jgi:radical SAM protein with 4Fe4S-binding SPASM domain
MDPIRVGSVRWDITNDCNLKCLHCYTVENPGSELSHSDVLQIIQKLLSLGLQEINFSGREPTMRRDLPEIIKYCSTHKIRVNVVTNGTVLKQEGFASLLQSGLNMLVFSLDGVSEISHDTIRGEGNFHRTIDSISTCLNYVRENEMTTKIGVNCTLQKVNALEVSRMIDLCHSLGTHFLNINPVSFCGSATNVREMLYLSPEEILSCWNKICEAYQRMRPDFRLYLGTSPMETKLLNAKYNLELPVIHTTCSAGNTLYIDPHGKALPCYMLPSMANEMSELGKYLCYWDILTEPANRAFDAFKPFISYAHAISKTSNSGCIDCPDVEICKGCPLIALSDPDATYRCQSAQKKLALIRLDFKQSVVPTIKDCVSWELKGDILQLSMSRGDYLSNREFELDPLAKSIWLKLHVRSPIGKIKKRLENDWSNLPIEKIHETLTDFVEYFWKEGLLNLEQGNG